MNIPVAGSTTQTRILTFGVDGSNLRQVTTYNASQWVDWLRWTPDGQWLLFVTQPVDRQPWRMMRVPAAGGAAEFDGLDSAAFVGTVPLPKMEIGNIANFEISPDGRLVVFGERTIPTYELTVRENMASSLMR